MKMRFLAAAIAASGLAACGADSVVYHGSGATGPGTDGKGTKADAWNSRNDPRIFADFLDKDLVYKLDELPMSGEAANTPWPDTYWPTYEDSTNVRWQGTGTLSPLEKFDRAFNSWNPDGDFMSLRPFNPSGCGEFDRSYYDRLGPAAKWMSENKGNQNSRDGVDSDGDGKVDECDDHDGVESWWGLCHAWAPAAIVEPEPMHAVDYNGVRFEVSDIKALIITVYDSSKSIILGGRCNLKDVERDEYGRIKASECRDTNAGAFHVIMANMLGRYNMALLEDRTYNYEVWNQPVRAFKVDNLKEITAAEANALMNREGEAYAYNDRAKKFAEVNATVSYITESSAGTRPLVPEIDRYTRTDSYHYIIEMDDRGTVIGGEWINGSRDGYAGRSLMPDFLWTSTGPGGYGSNPYVDYRKVKELLELSRAPVGGGDNGGDSGGTDGAFTKFSEPAKAIPDNAPAGISDSLTIDEARSAAKVSVTVDITHTYIGDLKVVLEKDGRQVATVHDAAGGSADNLTVTVEVPELAGQSVAGTYTLKVSDTAAVDTGTLNKWGIVAELQ